MKELIFDDPAWYDHYFDNARVLLCIRCKQKFYEHDLLSGLCADCEREIDKEMQEMDREQFGL